MLDLLADDQQIASTGGAATAACFHFRRLNSQIFESSAPRLWNIVDDRFRAYIQGAAPAETIRTRYARTTAMKFQVMASATREPPSLAMIHTVPGIIPLFADLVARHLPEWRPFNMLDESLLGNTIREGSLSTETMRRLANQIWSAVDAGASAVLVTCSSLGPAVDAAVPLCPMPLFRIDDGMAIEAIRHGDRIGVLATLATTLNPTTCLIERHARRMGREIALTSHLCDGAFERLRGGDKAGHDAMIREGLATLVGSVDVVVLAQASMANALNEMGDIAVPILTSPELGVVHMASALNGRTLRQERA